MNGNSPILKAKDCQELPQSIGDQIVLLIEGRAQAAGAKTPATTGQQMRSNQAPQRQQQEPQGMGGAGGRGMQGGRFGGRGGGMRPSSMMQGGMMPMHGHGMGMMSGGGEVICLRVFQ